MGESNGRQARMSMGMGTENRDKAGRVSGGRHRKQLT